MVNPPVMAVWRNNPKHIGPRRGLQFEERPLLGMLYHEPTTSPANRIRKQRSVEVRHFTARHGITHSCRSLCEFVDASSPTPAGKGR